MGLLRRKPPLDALREREQLKKGSDLVCNSPTGSTLPIAYSLPVPPSSSYVPSTPPHLPMSMDLPIPTTVQKVSVASPGAGWKHLILHTSERPLTIVINSAPPPECEGRSDYVVSNVQR